jgi:hypothetical protein
MALRKWQNTTWWDYAYPFTGIVAWVPLGMSGLGATVSMSNFVVEVFWIAVFSALTPWGRWLIARFEGRLIRGLSLGLTFLPLVAALVMRLAMPTLPE